MTAAHPTYHIIGAGISGLSAATFLRRKHPQAKIIIYEAASRLGGRVYSFDAPDWGMRLDNATHVILGANKHCLKLCGKDFPTHSIRFWNCAQNKLTGWFHCQNDISEAVFNTAFSDVSARQWVNVLRQLFPFAPKQFKAGFSTGNLDTLLLLSFEKINAEVRFGWKLTGFNAQAHKIDALLFGKRQVDILPEDKIISALDSHSFCRIFNHDDFEYNSIINIYFRTSMQITLPERRQLLGLNGGVAQWLFCSPGLLAVTISNANHIALSDEDLARQVWKEICLLRGREAAFMPDYKVLRHKRATIKQDKFNNAKRPEKAQTVWQNLQICGDWTMKNYPCCLETAIRSALRLK